MSRDSEDNDLKTLLQDLMEQRVPILPSHSEDPEAAERIGKMVSRAAKLKPPALERAARLWAHGTKTG
jgi:hypothetical protein